MTGIIVATPPTVELPPGSISGSPTLPPVTYQYAVIGLPQTWSGLQTFPLGTISVQAADVHGLAVSATTDTTNASNISSGTLADARLSFTPQANVATMAALRALAPGAYTSVRMLGYYAAGDGGEGVFIWNSTSTATDDTGTIIQPTLGGTGRWILRRPIGFYGPWMYGARGDGTNDATFVQKAIDSINTAGGGTLYFDKVYTVGVAGTLHANGFSIIDWKSGVNLDGPGGLKLADNVNVANSVGTATFAGTTMTFTSSSGTIALNQFISVANNINLLQVASFGTGTGGTGTYILTAVPTTSAGAPIAGPIAVKGVNRMVELIGAYNSTSNVLTNTFAKNILLDYNGLNNCASGTIWSFNAVATVQTGSSVDFESVRIRNNCGSNSLVLGTYQTTLTLSRVSIKGCSFENDGDRINAASIDYSAVFAVVDGLTASGNKFSLGPVKNGAAWEVYGQNIDVSGGSVSGYYGLANVVAIASQTTKNVNITGVSVQDCSVGATLWTLASSSKLQAINISSNIFSANVSSAGGPYVVNGVNQVTTGSELRDILISGNIWQNNDLSDTSRTTPGISLKAALTAKISDNLIYGIPGQGIYITGSLDPASIEITNNSLINTGYGGIAGAATKTGITLDASGTTGSLLIQSNLINPISGYTLTTGIKNALSVDSGLIQNNLILSATTPIANTGAGVISITQPATSGTLATLAGTEALTNKTINNSVIGGVTPAAGTFTTAIGSSAVLAGTASTPDALIVANGNSAATVAPVNTPQLHLIGPNAANAGLAIDGFGSAVRMEIRQANGTLAAKTATSASASIFSFNGYGWDTSAYALAAAFQFVPTQTWTAAAHGVQINFLTTPNGTTSIATAGVFQASGGFSVGASSIAAANGIGSIQADKAILSMGATSGLGYATGAGSTVTQGAGSGKATGVTLNNVCGAITMNNAALASGTTVVFTLTNSAIAATDVVYVCIKSGATAGAYRAPCVDAIAAGSCEVSITNGSGGSLSEAIVLNFVVIKAVAA